VAGGQVPSRTPHPPFSFSGGVHQNPLLLSLLWFKAATHAATLPPSSMREDIETEHRHCLLCPGCPWTASLPEFTSGHDEFGAAAPPSLPSPVSTTPRPLHRPLTSASPPSFPSQAAGYLQGRPWPSAAAQRIRMPLPRSRNPASPAPPILGEFLLCSMCSVLSLCPPGAMATDAAQPRPPAHRWQLRHHARRCAVTSVRACMSRCTTGPTPQNLLLGRGATRRPWAETRPVTVHSF
jgi:hypothetical protein